MTSEDRSRSRPRILVSGGTGFLGRQVVPRLREVAEVTVLSRTQPDCLKADLTLWDGGLDLSAHRGRFDLFLHMAGLYDLRVGAAEAYLHNVTGTHTALAIAQKMEIPHFVHTSTVAVAIGSRTTSVLRPDKLTILRRFPDAYSESKALAEQLVRTWRSDSLVSRTILRPGALVGDTHKGEIQRIDGPYHAVEGMRRFLDMLDPLPKRLPILVPGRSDLRLPLVPVDSAAQAIVRIIQALFEQTWIGPRSFHLAPAHGPTAEELFRSVLAHLGEAERPLKLLPRLPNSIVKAAVSRFIHLPAEELEYLLNFPRFDVSETERLLGADWCPTLKSYENALWSGYESYLANR